MPVFVVDAYLPEKISVCCVLCWGANILVVDMLSCPSPT